MPTTTPNTDPLPDSYESAARRAKALAYADVLWMLAVRNGEDPIHADTIDALERMDGSWWLALAKHARLRPPSPKTQAMVAMWLRTRREEALMATCPECAYVLPAHKTTCTKR